MPLLLEGVVVVVAVWVAGPKPVPLAECGRLLYSWWVFVSGCEELELVYELGLMPWAPRVGVGFGPGPACC